MKNSYDSRLKISLAQQYILENLSNEITLKEIAQISGLSQFHFTRIFKAYFGESPFEFVRRKRTLMAINLLEQKESITSIAFNVGFDSSSSFNKFFKKKLEHTPSSFRALEQSEKDKVIHTLNSSPIKKKLSMNLNMDEKFEIITRNEINIFTFKISGENFFEIAPIVWDQFLTIIDEASQDISKSEFLALSYMDNNIKEEQACIYKVAITSPKESNLVFEELEQEKMKEQSYAKFILKGSYQGIWPAFEKIFKILSETDLILAESPCLENYLNDPKVTPEEELLTELLIPLQ